MASARKTKSDKQQSPEYTVLARRYRPQQFDQIVGQEPVARALVNALKSNRVAHAYLFTGPRGVGKTSTARILAKALNCTTGPTPTPCDSCDICRSIASGEDVDVLEIDGASNRGIDEVREIRGNVQYRPGRSRYKIYIVDEVHMLTPAAFNALLKTLEEPPPHVKFIFATTEAQRIPVTILSRCQRFDFAGIGTPGILAQLRQVVAQEGLEADDEALELVARRAAGSMRDSQSLLDQLLAFGSDRLTVDQVHQLLGTARDERVIELASAVVERDAPKALELLGRAADEGLQLGELLDQMIAYWRDLMVLNCSGGAAQDLSVSNRHRDTLVRQATSLTLDTLLAGLDILSAVKARLRGSSHGRVLLEMAVVRLSRLDNLVSLSQLGRWLSQAPPELGSRNADRGSGPLARRMPDAERRTSVAAGTSSGAIQSARGAPDLEATPRSALAASQLEESLPQIWPQVIAQVGGFLGDYLVKGGLPAISGPNTLVLRFPAGYNHESEHCQKPGSFDRILKTLRGLVGETWTLRIQSEGGAGANPTPATVDSIESSLLRTQRLRDEAAKEPLIQKAMEALGAEIVRVDEGFRSTPVAAEPMAEAVEAEET